mgnify:CR=1 FL=1
MVQDFHRKKIGCKNIELKEHILIDHINKIRILRSSLVVDHFRRKILTTRKQGKDKDSHKSRYQNHYKGRKRQQKEKIQ